MDKKAQVAVEFLTTYGWVIVSIMILIAVLFYYGIFNPIGPVARQCNFEPGLPCTSYKLESNSAGGAEFIVELSNNLGYDISFPNQSILLNVENLGKAGKQTYAGNCTPASPNVIKPGATFTCIVNITDKDIIPSVGSNIKLQPELKYKNCLTDPNYITTGNCTPAASNYTSKGVAVTQMETYSNVTSYCGDGICSPSTGENTVTCPLDCHLPTSIILTANPTAVRANGIDVSTITATVMDATGPMQGVQVAFMSTPFGQLNSVIKTTDSSGNAVVMLSATKTGIATVTATAAISNSTTVNFYLCGNGVCEVGETYLTCPQDCCGGDCTALSPGGVSDNICHVECEGTPLGCKNFLLYCDKQVPGTMVCGASFIQKGECCDGQLISCGTATCPSPPAGSSYCDASGDSCTYPASCPNPCSGGVCGTCSCVAYCSPCTYGCSNGACLSGGGGGGDGGGDGGCDGDCGTQPVCPPACDNTCPAGARCKPTYPPSGCPC